MTERVAFGIAPAACFAAALVFVGPAAAPRQACAAPHAQPNRDRSPVDLAFSPDGQWLVVANQTSDSVSLVRTDDGKVVSEVASGKRPSAIVFTPDGRRALASATDSGELRVFELDGPRLRPAGVVRLGFEPRGIAVSPDGRVAYVALTAANEVAVQRFLDGEVRFPQIVEICKHVLRHHPYDPNPSLEVLQDVDRWAREESRSWITSSVSSPS